LAALVFSDQWSDDISFGLRMSLIIQENRDHSTDRGRRDWFARYVHFIAACW